MTIPSSRHDLEAMFHQARAAQNGPPTPPPPQPTLDFRPQSLMPSGLVAKLRANMEALAVLHDLGWLNTWPGRPANHEQKTILARWSGWGALPFVFDEARSEGAETRAQLRRLLSPNAYDHARRTVLNAHYTPPEIIRALWGAARELDPSAVTVLEPGCGAGGFIGLAPAGMSVTGVELDPTTAAVAAVLYPRATIEAKGFQTVEFPPGYFDLVIGNVPFGRHVLRDVRYNRARHTIHNHFTIKALEFLAPDGYAILITSRYALDAKDRAARDDIARLAELVTAVRLPNGAMRQAGTDVSVDVLVLRRRDTPADNEAAWGRAVEIPTASGAVTINEFFANHPEQVLGTVVAGRGMYRADELMVRADGREIGSALTEALRRQIPAPGREWAPESDRPDASDPSTEEAPGSVGEPNLAPPEAMVLLSDLDSEAVLDGLLDLPTSMTPPPMIPWPEMAEAAGVGIFPTEPEPVEVIPPDTTGRREGTIVEALDGAFWQVTYGRATPFAVPISKRKELRRLLGLRDLLAQLLALQSTVDDDEACVPLQRLLSEAYDAYSAAHGPLGRFSLTHTGYRRHRCAECANEWSAKKSTRPTRCPDCREIYTGEGEPKMKVQRPKMGGFHHDPAARSVFALEVFDAETQTARKAAIFTRRSVGPRVAVTSAETADAALALCLDSLGRVDLDEIGRLLGVEAGEARQRLGPLVWDDPHGGIVTAAEYLSGNVRRKLRRAERAAADDDRWVMNVEALRAVQPIDLAPAEIDARLGAPWIEVSDVRDFALETFAVPYYQRHRLELERTKVTATWSVRMGRNFRDTVAMTTTYGTARVDGVDLLVDSLNQKRTVITDEFIGDDGKKHRVKNVPATLAAQEKQEALEERFRAWVWEDDERAKRLAEVYNDRFNSYVVPTFDGSHLTCPGMALHFDPHPSQLDGAWRVIQGPTALLAHVVGAGKSATMAIAAMEMRRLGLVRKPMFIEPNHMLDQFSRELLQVYPLGNFLVVGRDDLSTLAQRKSFAARCATGDWDAVVITRSAFERIPMRPETYERYIREKIATYAAAIAESEEGSKLSVKRLEKAKASLEEKLQRLLNEEAKDDGVYFEELGVDFLFADEIQIWKNLELPSHFYQGAASQRASDLHLKLSWLRDKIGPRVLCGATATPISNTLAEMYVMQLYHAPERLAEAGIGSFDEWAATFGSTVVSLEMSPDGGSFRMNTRFSRFRNLPELVSMFRAFADVRTREDLADIVKTPAIAGDKPEIVVVDMTEAQRELVATLVIRAEQIRNGHPTTRVSAVTGKEYEDNILAVCNDGRKAALDLRLINPQPGDDTWATLLALVAEVEGPDPRGKIGAAADRIVRHWRDGAQRTYTEPDGTPMVRPGTLQLVFCDLGTPKAHHWDAYTETREQLVKRGMPRGMIRFIHEASDDRAKDELFAACKDGRVAVLMGSTDKMGMGTNVQTRLVAMHHLDCPWRPDWIEQRDGRGIRQGNQNPVVSIYRYATKGSFDVYMYQGVERKARFIYQVMSGQIGERIVDDVGDAALSYAEIKALATGNPLVMEKAGIDAEVARLLRMHTEHLRDQRVLRDKVEWAETKAPRLAAYLASCESAIATRQPFRDDHFAMTVAGQTYTKRSAAADALEDALDRVVLGGATGASHSLGSFAGFDVLARLSRERTYNGEPGRLLLECWMNGCPDISRWEGEMARNVNGQGAVTRLENLLTNLEYRRDETIREALALTDEMNAATERLGQPFPHQDRLDEGRARQRQINEALDALDEGKRGQAA